MLAGAAASARAYGLGPGDRRLNIMPLFHIQAVVGSLLCSLWSGSSVVLVRSFSPSRVLGLLADRHATWFSATPTMHQEILDAAAHAGRRAPALRFVRVGSSALTQPLRARLEEFYQVPVVESYGMTEAHQIASVPLPDGTSAAGLIPTGARVAILGADGEPVTSAGARGEIVVSGPNVVSGYLWPPEENERAFTRGWFRTGDEGELLPDGSLRIVGRIKELINRGGEKISPSDVERVLLDHPAVVAAAVCGVPDEVWTEQVAAALVLRPGHQASAAEMREYARTRLAAFKVPARIVFREALPLTDTGKVSRRLLALELAEESTPEEEAKEVRPDRVPPRTAVEAALTGIWSQALKAGGIGVEDDFFALGGESLQAIALLTMVQEVFDVEIEPLVLFDDVTTVALMAELIEKHRATPGSQA
jgi:acyl-CoA synthetase (AMP-forming)/AMP-acid ligase II/acyl carrier protein